MPLDDRLREALHDGVVGIEPDVERHLAHVRQRSRRAGMPKRGLAVVVLTVATLAIAVRFGWDDPSTLPAPDRATVPAAPARAADANDALVGTYRATLDDAVGAADPPIAGEWVLELRPDSGIVLAAPDTFEARSDAPLSGYVYAVSGELLYTNLLARHLGHDCATSGTYRWRQVDVRLSLEEVADTCRERVALLTSREWTRSSE